MGLLGGCPVLDCCRTTGHLWVLLANLVEREEKVADLEEIWREQLTLEAETAFKSLLCL